MRSLKRASLACLGAVAAALTGCSVDTSQGRQLERQGQYAQSYESYLEFLQTNPSNASASAGLRRTASLAVEYWEQQAREAAEAGQWQRAAQAHLKVLQIKPDESASLAAMRQLQRRYPDEAELALASAPPLPPGMSLSTTEAATAAGPTPAPPRPEPVLLSPLSMGPTRREPEAHPPAPSTEKPIPSGEYVLVVRLSKEDHRYPEKSTLRDGLEVKLKGTEKRPAAADLEIYLADKRIARLRKVVAGSVITAAAMAGTRYDIVLMDVTEQTETITLGLRQNAPQTGRQ